MTAVNPPPQLRIPRQFMDDKEVRAFFERQRTILFQLWRRTGGGSDSLAEHEALLNQHIDWTIDQGATNIDPANIDASSLEVLDEGSSLTLGATKLNFVGAGVTATEPVADEITVTIPGSSGGGAWETAVADITPTNTNTFDITWDETKYAAIRLEWEAVETDTDAGSMFLQVGSANGGTIYNSVGDYSHKYTELGSTTWVFDASLGDIRLSTSWGSAAGEGSYGSLEVIAANDSNNGGILNYDHVYRRDTGALTQRKGFVALEGNIAAAVDTVRFGIVAGGHSFLASGTVRVYGLLKTPGAGGGAVSIDDLSDVDTSTDAPNIGDELVWDGTNWVTSMTQLIKEVDDVAGTTIYIGEAQPGTTTAAAAWRVKRIVFTGDDSETLYADGNSNFDNTWTGRAGFSYS